MLAETMITGVPGSIPSAPVSRDTSRPVIPSGIDTSSITRSTRAARTKSIASRPLWTTAASQPQARTVAAAACAMPG